MVQQGSSPASTGPASTSGRNGLSFGLVATLLGGGLLLDFVVQNREDVTFHLLWWGLTWPLWLFTVVTATLGAVLWVGLGVLRRHRRRVARRDARDD